MIELTQNVCRLYQIEDDIKSSRVKIKINPSDRIRYKDLKRMDRQGIADSLSDSEESSEGSGEEYAVSRSNSRSAGMREINGNDEMLTPYTKY